MADSYVRHTCHMRHTFHSHGVPTMSKLLEIIGLFCNRALLNSLYSAKETYNFKEPINRSHPICVARHMFMCDSTHAILRHDSWVCVTSRLAHMCAMTHSYVWHVSYVCHGSLTCVTWLIHMCGVTHSCVWHDLFICVTWLIHTCDMSHSYVCHDSCICVTWLIHMCDMTHSYVWHDSFMCVTCLIHMCDMTHSYGY